MARNYFNRYIWLIDLIQRSGHISFEDIDRAWQRSSLNPNALADAEACAWIAREIL